MRGGKNISLHGEELTITTAGPTIKVGSHPAGITNFM
jgi:hypothetical protein